MTLARELADLPPLSLRAIKRVLNACAADDLKQAIALETDGTIAGFLDPETTRRLKHFG